jgi:hypothetical protein
MAALVMPLVLTSFAMAGEKDVLKALEKIKWASETEVSYEGYVELVADAKVEINILKKADNKNDCFVKAVEYSHAFYREASMQWKSKLTFESAAADSMTEARFEETDELIRLCVQSSKTFEKMAKDHEKELQEAWKKAAAYLDKAYGCLK